MHVSKKYIAISYRCSMRFLEDIWNLLYHAFNRKSGGKIWKRPMKKEDNDAEYQRNWKNTYSMLWALESELLL